MSAEGNVNRNFVIADIKNKNEISLQFAEDYTYWEVVNRKIDSPTAQPIAFRIP
jgi:hypothetical protein